jgi:hypothetical protein
MNVNTANESDASAPQKVTAIVGDLKDVSNRVALAARIKKDIDAWCVETYSDGHRRHLGASLIGRECSRFLWYTFRWVQHFHFDGRRQRLFQRGHREEPQMIAMLEGIGATVSWFDDEKEPDENGEYPQHRISGCEGHFGGSMDAKLWLPEHYGIPFMFINEYKTQGTGPKFASLKKNGVRIEKPDHFTQMSVYGWKEQQKYGVYMAVNKNDDDLHVEVVELDWALAQRMELKAHNIIFTRTPPPKLSESIAHTQCVYCDMKAVCHQNEPYEKNCRSCAHSEAAPGAQWGCHHWKALIPADAIKAGCDQWTPAV